MLNPSPIEGLVRDNQNLYSFNTGHMAIFGNDIIRMFILIISF